MRMRWKKQVKARALAARRPTLNFLMLAELRERLMQQRERNPQAHIICNIFWLLCVTDIKPE